MSIHDHPGAAVGKWKRPGVLLEGELPDDEGSKNPPIQIASPQMGQGSRGHHPMQRA